MMKRLTAIVIKATDFRDNDKMITLFSAEEGKTSAIMKGVKKKDAKLKFACQLFNYGEYELIMPSASVTGCSQKDSFFAVTADYEAFLAACVIAEVLSGDFTGNENCAALFSEALKALTALKMGARCNVTVALFLLRATVYLGFGSKRLNYLLADRKLYQIYGSFADRIQAAADRLEAEGYSCELNVNDEIQVLLELFALFYEQNITRLKTLDDFNALMNN